MQFLQYFFMIILEHPLVSLIIPIYFLFILYLLILLYFQGTDSSITPLPAHWDIFQFILHFIPLSLALLHCNLKYLLQFMQVPAVIT